MTTHEKCEAILKKVLEIVNEDNVEKTVMFSSDWGGNSMTITIDGAHTHVELPEPDGTWELLVENLYNTLHGGPGLSWAKQ